MPDGPGRGGAIANQAEELGLTKGPSAASSANRKHLAVPGNRRRPRDRRNPS